MLLVAALFASSAVPPVGWDAPETCPSAQAVREQVAHLSRSEAGTPTGPVASGRVEGVDGSWRLELDVVTLHQSEGVLVFYRGDP